MARAHESHGDEPGELIGYSGLDLDEECYEYFENACYIADTAESAESLMQQSMNCVGPYRVEVVTLDRLMSDYGASCGEYALEPAAWARFERMARAKGIRFECRTEACDVPLTIVEVHGVKISD